jgi:hypothetical protein
MKAKAEPSGGAMYWAPFVDGLLSSFLIFLIVLILQLIIESAGQAVQDRVNKNVDEVLSRVTLEQWGLTREYAEDMEFFLIDDPPAANEVSSKPAEVNIQDIQEKPGLLEAQLTGVRGALGADVLEALKEFITSNPSNVYLLKILIQHEKMTPAARSRALKMIQNMMSQTILKTVNVLPRLRSSSRDGIFIEIRTIN